MSLTKVTYSMIDGAWLNVTDFGADPTGTVDSTAAIQAALDADGDVWFPAGRYIITASLELGESKRIMGEGGRQVDAGLSPPVPPANVRTQCAILPRQAGNLSALGNYPAFINKSGISGRQYHIKGFNIWWELNTPTDAATQDNRYGFKFVPNGTAQWAAPYSVFEDIEVNGAWYVYYDDSDNYLNKFSRVIGRWCKYGFYKRLGTLMRFEECGNSIGDQSFYFQNVISPILINCAADSMEPKSDTPGLAAVYFADSNSSTVIGWDAEGAEIYGNNRSYMNFTRTTGSIQGFTGLGNRLDCTTGEFVSWFLVNDNSEVTIFGFDRKYRSVSQFEFLGSAGDVATIRCIVGSKCVVIGSDVRAPTGGTPTNRYSLFGTGGTLTSINSTTDSQNVINGVELTGNTVKSSQLILGDLPIVTNKADDHGGNLLFPSFFGDVPITGKLHAVELGTGNYLIAELYKAGTSSAVVATVTASSGLSISGTNAVGSIALAGYSVSGNVRMKVFIYDTTN